MSLEDRIRSSVDQAIESLVQQVLAHAEDARAEAVAAEREKAFADAEQAAVARVSDAEARVRATMDDAIASARQEDRAVAAREIRRELDAEFEARLADALSATESRATLALADAEARAAEAMKASVAAACVREREIEMAGVTRLLDSIRGLDGAASLSEVLDALALAAARETARAAVVVLRADRVQGWRLSGFGPRDANPKSVDLALAEAGVIGMAVGAARAVTTRDGQTAASGPGFEQLPGDRMGLAVPVVVGGRVVAVVYADSVALDGHDRQTPSAWPELIEVLARHAGRCLEALTSQRSATPPKSGIGGPRTSSGATGATDATGASGGASASGAGATGAAHASNADGAPVDESARRMARLLVSEIRLYHEPAVDEGRRERNLLARLAPQIEKARRAYNEQVPALVRGRTDIFQQELIRTLAGGDASLLGNLA